MTTELLNAHKLIHSGLLDQDIYEFNQLIGALRYDAEAVEREARRMR